MKLLNGNERTVHDQPWKYVLEDLLELSCSLSQEARHALLSKLDSLGIVSGAVDVHPAFSLEDRMVVIVDDQRSRECWIYRSKEKKMDLYRPQ